MASRRVRKQNSPLRVRIRSDIGSLCWSLTPPVAFIIHRHLLQETERLVSRIHDCAPHRSCLRVGERGEGSTTHLSFIGQRRTPDRRSQDIRPMVTHLMIAHYRVPLLKHQPVFFFAHDRYHNNCCFCAVGDHRLIGSEYACSWLTRTDYRTDNFIIYVVTSQEDVSMGRNVLIYKECWQACRCLKDNVWLNWVVEGWRL